MKGWNRLLPLPGPPVVCCGGRAGDAAEDRLVVPEVLHPQDVVKVQAARLAVVRHLSNCAALCQGSSFAKSVVSSVIVGYYYRVFHGD